MNTETTPESSPEVAPPFELVIEDDRGKRRRVPLDGELFTIGRLEDNDVWLDERNVSRRHARLIQVEGGFFVEEISARYGTRINEEPLDGRELLGEGDELRVGDFTLSLKRPYDETEDAPPLASVADEERMPLKQQGRLVVISNDLADQRFALRLHRVLIGRSHDCDLVLDHESVSREHALITWDEVKGFRINNLSDKNPVLINGEAHPRYRLREGDKLVMGTIRMRYCAPGSKWTWTKPVAPPPAPQNKALMIAVIAAVVLLGAAVVWILSGDKETPAAPEKPTEAQKILVDMTPEEIVAEAEGFAKDCETSLGRGELEEARESCFKATSTLPDEPRYQALSAEVEAELLAEKDAPAILASARARQLAACEAANTTMATRPALARRVSIAVKDCLDAAIERDIGALLALEKIDEASKRLEAKTTLLSSEATARISAQITSATETLAAETRKRRDRREKKVVEEVPDAEAEAEAEAARKTEATSLAEEARGKMLNDPYSAVKLYRKAVKLHPSTRIRTGYALALERAQQPCKAAKIFKKIRGKLSGSNKTMAEKLISECNL